jgi:hypothetical protein
VKNVKLFMNRIKNINAKLKTTRKTKIYGGNYNMEFRKLDGIYFRINRDNKWQNICFSDLTENEMKEVMENRSLEWLQSLAISLGKTLRNIGDQLDLSSQKENED